MHLTPASNKLFSMDEKLLESHRFRIGKLAQKYNVDPEQLYQKVRTTCRAFQSQMSPAPSFLHWLFLFSLKALREERTGYTGFDGLFETPPEDFKPTQSFSAELNKYLEWMTDDKMEHYRMRFEDGLVFEEMAAHLQKKVPAQGEATPWQKWLEDWKEFSAKIEK